MEGAVADNPSEPGMSNPKDQGFLDRLSLKNLRRAGIVALLGVTAGFGGLDTVEPMTPVSLGETYSNGPLEITPHRVTKVCGIRNPEVGVSTNATFRTRLQQADLFVMTATVKNTEDTSVPANRNNSDGEIDWSTASPTGRELFELDIPTEHFSQGTVDRDSLGENIPAGATVDVVTIWGVPKGQLKPQQDVVIRINDFRYQQRLSAPVKEWYLDVANPSYGELHTHVSGCLS